MTRSAAARVAAGGVFLLLAGSPGIAQSATRAQYRLGSDTLHYVEATTTRMTMQAPTGEIVVQTAHDAAIALRGIGAGRAEGWYEKLALRQEGPGAAVMTPDAGAALGQPFDLLLTPTGRLDTQRAPVMPASVAGITDLTRQFDDFFITVPSQALRPGVTWSDTLVRTRGTSKDSSSVTQHLRSYRVVSDTTVAGRRGVVITTAQSIRVESAAPMRGGSMRAVTVLQGDETGRAIFLPEAGVLLSRERRGLMTGQLEMVGGAQRIVVPQRYEYTTKMGLQPRGT